MVVIFLGLSFLKNKICPVKMGLVVGFAWWRFGFGNCLGGGEIRAFPSLGGAFWRAIHFSGRKLVRFQDITNVFCKIFSISFKTACFTYFCVT